MPTKDPRILFQTSDSAWDVGWDRERDRETEGNKTNRNCVYGKMRNGSLIISVIMVNLVTFCFILYFHHGFAQSHEIFFLNGV